MMLVFLILKYYIILVVGDASFMSAYHLVRKVTILVVYHFHIDSRISLLTFWYHFKILLFFLFILLFRYTF